MPSESQRHLLPEEVERYSAGLVSENEAARWEEHLLICDLCRQALSEHEYRTAMRSAAGRLRRSEGDTGPWRWASVWIPAAAFLVVLAILAALVLSRWSGAPAAFAVTLTTARGHAMEARAPAGTPLSVSPDLTGLPPRASYKLELVDEVGRSVWRGDIGGSAQKVALPGLASGTYYARVYSPEGALLREYGLVIEDRRRP